MTSPKRTHPIHFPQAVYAELEPRLEQLCRAIERQTGLHRVYPYHAIRLAVEEAIASRGQTACAKCAPSVRQA